MHYVKSKFKFLTLVGMMLVVLNLSKKNYKEAVEWPIKHKEAFDYVDVESPKGVLLHGPPGTGKTLIAKAVAKMTESNFISIKGPELLSKWVGESEKESEKFSEKLDKLRSMYHLLR